MLTYTYLLRLTKLCFIASDNFVYYNKLPLYSIVVQKLLNYTATSSLTPPPHVKDLRPPGQSVLVKHVEFSGDWLLWAHPHREVERQVINPEGGAIIEDNHFRGRPPADKEIMRQNSDAGPARRAEK